MSNSDTSRADQTRTYDRASSVVFLKTDAPFGGLSNMAGGFAVCVNEIPIRTSEALYQACRFPHRPEVQALIIEQKSPMTAKMKSKPYRHDSRPDWDEVRVKIMRWCLRVKLAQNWRSFSELLLETGERPIVEESRRDAFWGAKAIDDGTLVGMNVLGRLLMELREAIRVEGDESLMSVQPLAIPDFLLGGRLIEIVTSQDPEHDVASGTAGVGPARGETQRSTVKQPSLFDAPAVKEAPPVPYAPIRAKGVHVADLKPYPEYKESGSKWLGRIPGHWETRPAFGAFVPNRERNHGMKEKTVLSLSYGRIVIKPAEKLHGLIPESFETYQIVNSGDIVLRTTDLQNDHTSLRVGMVRDRGIITSAYLALRTSPGVSPEFGFQFLNVWDSSKAIYGYGSGLRQNLDFSHFKRMPVAVPPPDEQAAIVRVLDWANGRLERAIRAKRKVIALLDEQKQAIIHRALTRGLDPSVPLEPSENRWFAELPTGWQALTLRRVITSAIDGPHFSPQYQDTGIPFLSARNVRADRWILGNAKFISEADYNEFSRRVRPEVGDVLYTKGGTTGVARAVDLTFPFQVWVHIAVLKLKRNLISPAFLAYSLNSPRCYEQAQLFTRGATNQDLGLARMKDIELLVPPTLDEQNAIANFLDSECSTFTTAISSIEREIELLREYRTRLVADVVTGKLDVREAAARLPDDAPLGTAEDDAELDDETALADEEAAV